jgi:metal-responsive CopG/Arc/MetJ family transcriptional regulator
MAKPTDERQLIHMRLDQALLKRLEDFRFRHRFQSRSEAARWLMKAALDAKLAPKEE